MTSAELVNLILEKLTTSKVKFIEINREYPSVSFAFGGNEYIADVPFGMTFRINVIRIEGVLSTIDNYSRLVEGVLNGKTRNDKGELS